MTEQHYDVAIIGGGPAGMQAALVLSRTRKKVILFDAPEPPRNGASHGVHNFHGLDDMLPSEIRDRAWEQINVYQSAEHRTERIVDVQPQDTGFIVSGADGTKVTAQHVILAIGFRDVYPDVPGFQACWGDTIITCPFCDGYENRDRVWGLVMESERALMNIPKMYKNWTPDAKLILTSTVTIDDDYRSELTAQELPIYEGDIIEVHHTGSKVTAVTLDTDEKVDVGTLIWAPDEHPLPLTQAIINTFKLELDERGYIKTDMMHQTSYNGLWAVGDIQGWATALGAAHAGAQAGYMIIHEWYAHQTATA